VYSHPAAAPIVAAGGAFRPLDVTPGVVNWLLWRLFVRPPVDETLHDGQVPIAGGLTVLHAPGHCRG
jgi:glyoxylase-like metal-dependent hydrolase (beta-lactamase superfamily II)